MQDCNKPLGQRQGDGHYFGHPFFWHAFSFKRAHATAPDNIKREREGWLDRVGQPHGRTNDKLARKVLTGTVGLRHSRGPYAAWAMTAKMGKRMRGDGYQRTPNST